MKIVIITSDLTYVPNNYDDVFEYVLSHVSDQVVGIVLIKINKLSTVAKLPYLYAVGCENIATTLAKNIYTALRGDKKKLLSSLEIPFMFTKDVNSNKTISWIKAMKPDIIINMRTRCIYQDTLLQVPRLGCVNVHHGILPSQKGLFCDLHAMADDRATGFTIHSMTKSIDAGNVFYREEMVKNNNYMSYLKGTALKEKVAIVNLIKQIASEDSLPPVLLLENADLTVTSTPNRPIVKEMQKRGIIL